MEAVKDVELQSRLQSLLKSNEPPRSHEAVSVAEFLEDRLVEISHLERRIAKLRTEAELYTTILSGVRKLPPELLVEIFIHYTAPFRERYHRFSTYPRPDTQSPIILSHVCKKWRHTALSTPVLWSTISLPHRTSLGCINYAGLVEHCITNSRISPLYITFSILGFVNQKHSTGAARSLRYTGALDTLEKLMSEIGRWRHLYFNVFERIAPLTPRNYPLIPLAGAPNLRKIFFRSISAEPHSIEVLWALELLRSSPNLRKIEFSAPIWSLEVAPWVHLQHFQVRGGIRMKDLFLVFEGCPSLQYCEACFELESGDPSLPSFDDSDSLVQLSQLHSLHLTHLRQVELEAVLQWLTLPSLTSLTLAGHHVSDAWPDELFRTFFSRSACKLNKLSLSRFSFSDANMISYLQLPGIHDTLEHLELEKWKTPISPELLNFLTFRFSSDPSEKLSPVLPNLKDVSFAIHAIVQAVRLREFFLSRWYERDNYQAPFPVKALERMAVVLLVPYLPNATVSGDFIRGIFSRVEDIIEIELETLVVDGGANYPDIEKLEMLIDSI